MTKPVNPKADSSIIAVAKTEPEKELIRYFKEVLARDGLEMRTEIFKLIEHDWITRHPRPGNPQKQLVQFDGSKKARGLCEVDGCSQEAEYICHSAYPFGKDRRLCSHHRVDEERRNNVRKSVKLKSK